MIGAVTGSIPRPPAIPASLAALVTLLGLGLVYWSLSGLGLIKPATAPVVTGGGTVGSGMTGTGGNPGKAADDVIAPTGSTATGGGFARAT